MQPRNSMPMRTRSAIGAYIAVLNLSLVGLLIRYWPVPLIVAPQPGELSPEGRYLLTAALAGALGSYIHLATSFVEHAGAGRLSAPWGWWYLLRPGIGSSLALMVYFVVRAGLISGGAEAVQNVNPFGIAAVSAMSGLFSRHATQKLRELFDQFLASSKDPRDEASDGPEDASGPDSSDCDTPSRAL
jgi:hypothetical protein